MANRGQSVSSRMVAVGATVGALSAAAGTASAIGSAISSAADVGSAIRSVNLPAAGEAIGDIMGAISMFGGDDAANDWRVRLSLANWVSFKTSSVLKPLKEAGGLVFPYTPQIGISSSASYQPISTTHSNYTFNAYTRSQADSISITAPFFVEDATQALYWIAAVHYLRSLTKMFSGNDMKAGNPPPIVKLNGYGAYVFKNVPCVVTSMKVELMGDCDYIGTEVKGSAAGALADVADSLGGLADTLGGALPGLSGVTSTVSSIAGGVGQVAGMLGAFGIGGSTSGGITHVPTKSSMIITLQPMYSRAAARNFSLDRFVSGGYMNSSQGYV